VCSSNDVTTQLTGSFCPLRAAPEISRARRVAILLREQSHLQQRLLVVGVEVKSFSVEVNGLGFAAGIPDQSQKIIGVSRGPVLAEMRFANASGFGKASGVGQFLGLLELSARSSGRLELTSA